MTREIAVEYARQGIRANALCPGPVETPMLAELLKDPQRRARRLLHIPLRRFWQAGEIGRAGPWPASGEAALLTRAAVVVGWGVTPPHPNPGERKGASAGSHTATP